MLGHGHVLEEYAGPGGDVRGWILLSKQVAWCAVAANRVKQKVMDTNMAILLDQEVNGIVEAVEDELSDFLL